MAVAASVEYSVNLSRAERGDGGRGSGEERPDDGGSQSTKNAGMWVTEPERHATPRRAPAAGHLPGPGPVPGLSPPPPQAGAERAACR